NVTSILVVLFAADEVITTCPDTTTPDHEPFGKNVSGPHLPDPSPLTTNLSFVDRNTAGVAFGNVFVVGSCDSNHAPSVNPASMVTESTNTDSPPSPPFIARTDMATASAGTTTVTFTRPVAPAVFGIWGDLAHSFTSE